MSIIVQKRNKILLEEERSTTKKVIDGMTCSGVSSFLVVFVNSREEIPNIKNSIIYGGKPYYNDSNVIMGYKEKTPFPITASDSSKNIPGRFEINYGAVVYYKNRLEIEKETFLSNDVIIYTTEALKDIIKEYSQTRKCIVISEYPSDNKPTILTPETSELTPQDFNRMLNGGAVSK